MKFTVVKDIFLEALQEVSFALPRSSTIPIMNNMYLKLEGNLLSIQATNMDFSIHHVLEIEGHEDGEITIPGKPLVTVISNSPSGVIEVSAQGTNARVTSGSGIYNLIGMSPEDFPPRKEIQPESVVEIPWPVIRKGTGYVGFCAAKGDARPYLNGILWQLRDGELRFVASDAHRLAFYRVISSEFQGDANVIVPRDAQEFFSKRDSREDMVKVLFSENQIGFESRKTTLISRVIEGPYANYEDVIPRPDGNILRVTKAALEDSFKRIMPFTEAPSHLVRIDLSSTGVKLNATSYDIGDATENLDASYIGEDMQVGINGQSLLEIIRHVDDEDIIIRFYTPTTALRIDPANTVDDESLLYLIMPSRLE